MVFTQSDGNGQLITQSKTENLSLLLICVNDRIKKTSNFDDNSIVNVASLCKMNYKKGASQHLKLGAGLKTLFNSQGKKYV